MTLLETGKDIKVGRKERVQLSDIDALLKESNKIFIGIAALRRYTEKRNGKNCHKIGIQSAYNPDHPFWYPEHDLYMSNKEAKIFIEGFVFTNFFARIELADTVKDLVQNSSSNIEIEDGNLVVKISMWNKIKLKIFSIAKYFY
jgi:hypothetical protein